MSKMTKKVDKDQIYGLFPLEKTRKTPFSYQNPFCERNFVCKTFVNEISFTKVLYTKFSFCQPIWSDFGSKTHISSTKRNFVDKTSFGIQNDDSVAKSRTTWNDYYVYQSIMKLYLLVGLALVVGGLDEEEAGRLDDKVEDFEEDFVLPLSDFCLCWWLKIFQASRWHLFHLSKIQGNQNKSLHGTSVIGSN